MKQTLACVLCHWLISNNTSKGDVERWMSHETLNAAIIVSLPRDALPDWDELNLRKQRLFFWYKDGHKTDHASIGLVRPSCKTAHHRNCKRGCALSEIVRSRQVIHLVLVFILTEFTRSTTRRESHLLISFAIVDNTCSNN